MDLRNKLGAWHQVGTPEYLVPLATPASSSEISLGPPTIHAAAHSTTGAMARLGHLTQSFTSTSASSASSTSLVGQCPKVQDGILNCDLG